VKKQARTDGQTIAINYNTVEALREIKKEFFLAEMITTRSYLDLKDPFSQIYFQM